jgi:hypothetical protein
MCINNPIKPSVINPSNPGTPAKEALSNCNYVYVGGDGLQYLHIYLMVIWHKIN